MIKDYYTKQPDQNSKVTPEYLTISRNALENIIQEKVIFIHSQVHKNLGSDNLNAYRQTLLFKDFLHVLNQDINQLTSGPAYFFSLLRRDLNIYYQDFCTECDEPVAELLEQKMDKVLYFKEVNRIYVREGYEPFYHHAFSKAFNLKSNNGAYNRKQILQEIKDQNFRIEQARDFMISGEFTNVDCQAVKKEAEKRITMLEAQLPDLAFTYKNVDMILTGALSNLKKLSTVYKSDILRKKQAIVGSIYPENLMFDGFAHRTTRTSDVVHGILVINKKLGPKKLDKCRII